MITSEDGPGGSDRRDPAQQQKRRGGRRATDHYWTVPEIARDLGISERSVWRKFLAPPDGPRLLDYYDFDRVIRVSAADYEAFKKRHFRPRTPDAA